jgi:drug/metabolite transporter (DMT)-like permease
MSPSSLAWLQIHFCVFLWGFTAIIGRLITLPSMPLVLWRMALVTLALLCLPRVWRGLSRMPPTLLRAFCGVGAIVALHWVTFYSSVKLANASVTATCMATLPIFMCFVEPLVTGRRFSPREFLLALLILPGMALVVGGTPEQMNLGIAVGVVSSFLAALFSALNKRLILRTDSLTATAVEMGSGAVLVLLLVIATDFSPLELSPKSSVFIPAKTLLELPSSGDLLWLLVLALVCTLLPFALSLVALRHLSAYATALAVNLEPIYAIVLGILILSEQQQLNPSFYVGAVIILTAVFIYPALSKPDRRATKKLVEEQLSTSDQ